MLLMIAALLVVPACQPDPEPEPPAQDEPMADTPLSMEEVVALQESLHEYLEPGTFRAELQGSPFDDDTEATLTERSLQGTAAAADTASADGSREGLHVVLHGAGGTTITLTLLRQMPDPDAPDSLLAPNTYTQQPDEQPPFVAAQMQQGGHRFTSRSGTLTLDAMTEAGVQGRFFFEMHRPSDAERDEWFSLVGVFDTGVNPDA